MNYKSFKYSELEFLLNFIPFKKKPYLHQLVSFSFVLSQGLNKIFLFHDIGLGKTFTALYLLMLWDVKGRILVISPNSVIKTWKEQIEEYTDFSYEVLDGSSDKRLQRIIESKAKILIINYEGLKLIGARKIGKNESCGKKSKGYMIDLNSIKKLSFEAVIADESHRFKDPLSIQTRISNAIVKRARYAILMTGTPIGNSAIDLYGQCYVLDDGAIFGTNYNYFLRHFYYKPTVMSYNWEPKRVCGICNELYDYKKRHLEKHKISLHDYRKRFPKEKTSEDLIIEAVKDISISYKKEECLDLPERIYEERSVYPTAEQQTWISNIIVGLKIEEIKKNLKYHIIRLLQITGGSLIHGENKTHIFRDNPKIEELNILLSELSGQIIIYHLFIEESILIKRLLDKKKISYSLLNGGIKNKEEQINFFLNGKSQILIAHPKSGGEGLNLQCATNMIFYSSSFMGTILREQAEGRIHRSGQKNTCLYFDIIMEDTVDRILFDSLKNRTDYIYNMMKYLTENKK